MLAKIRNTFTYKYLTFCGILTILTAIFIVIPSSTIGAWVLQVTLVGILTLISIIPIIIDIIRHKKLTERKSRGIAITSIEFIIISIFLLQAFFALRAIAPELLPNLLF